jgi:DNA mismatch repair protein MLH3
MFNDELTIDQCTTLVHRLGDCAFPFQCAHGRPSVIPLVDLGGISSILSNSQIAIAKRASTSGKSDNDFTTAFRAWKE